MYWPPGSLEAWVVVPAWAVLAALLVWGEHRWTLRRLQAWALREGLEILGRERRFLRRGPYGLFGRYAVFRVRVRDGRGRERSGWVAQGGNFNAWTDRSEARWDDGTLTK